MSDGIFILITAEFFGFLFLTSAPHVDDVVFIVQDCLTFCVFIKSKDGTLAVVPSPKWMPQNTMLA